MNKPATVLKFPKVDGESARHVQTQQIKDSIKANQFYRWFNDGYKTADTNIKFLQAYINSVEEDLKISQERLLELGFTRADSKLETNKEDLKLAIKDLDTFVTNCNFLLVMMISPLTDI